MEIITLFITLVIVLVLAFIIANAGAKRNIGFGWALFLGLFLSPIVSFVAVLLSDKIVPDEYGRVNKKWGCLAPSILTAFIMLTVIYIFYSYQEKRNLTANKYQGQSTISIANPFTSIEKMLQKESSHLDKYKIDDEDGKTEIERTVILKFNNLLDLCSQTLSDSKNGNTISVSDKSTAMRYMHDFTSFVTKNDTNISQSLLEKLKTSITGLQKDFPMDNPSTENIDVNSSIANTRDRVIYTTDLTVESPPLSSKPSTLNEIPIDLNDYFNSKNGWDEETDWNQTGFEDEEEAMLFDKILKDNGIYYSDKLKTWAKKK